jgi:anti-sigma factor RsiW
MWKIACRWARPRLALLAGGELTGIERRRAERHLITCGECRTRMESLQETIGALGLLRAEVATADAPSLWPAVARQIQESRHPQSTISFARPMWIGLGIAASALAIVGVTSWTLNGRTDRFNGLITANADASRALDTTQAVTDVVSSATDADNTAPSRPDGDNISAPAPVNSRKESGRIGVEPTQ